MIYAKIFKTGIAFYGIESCSFYKQAGIIAIHECK